MHDDPEQQQGINIPRLLRNLPQEIRQPYDWTEFRRRSRERTSFDIRRSASVKRYAALAAALVIVIVGIASWVRIGQSQVSMPRSLSIVSMPARMPQSVGSPAFPMSPLSYMLVRVQR